MKFVKKLITSTVQLALIALVANTTACNVKNADSTTGDTSNEDAQVYNAESAMSAVGSAAGSAEGATTLQLQSELADEFQQMDYLDSKSINPHPSAACSLSAARSSCNVVSGSSSYYTLTWGGCSLGTGTMSGTWTEVFNNGSCSMASNSNVITRTTTGAVFTGALGQTFTTDTNGGVTYDGTSMLSTGVILANAASGSDRYVSINSIHRVLRGPGGAKWFDYFISTPTAITVTGARATNNRTVSSGTLNIYHNMARYTASHSFSNVVWGDSTCCYPTSGTITSTFTGAVTGSTTMTFSSTCGSASFTDTSSATSAVTLTQCQ